MRRFIRITFGIYALACLLIMLAGLLPIHPRCLRPYTQFTPSSVQTIDAAIGIEIALIHGSQSNVSPDGQLRYRIILGNGLSTDIVLYPTDGTETPSAIFTTFGRVRDVYWSADNRTLYIAEFQDQGSTAVSVVFAVDIASGNIIHSYPPYSFVMAQSPNERYLYIRNTQSQNQASYLASIDTVTGEFTPIDLEPVYIATFWSPDEDWMVLRNISQLRVVRSDDGQAHPAIPAPFAGLPVGLVWTDHHLWYRTFDGFGSNTVHQISLDNGSVEQIYDGIDSFDVSPNERWHMLRYASEPNEIDTDLVDTQTNTTHTNFTFLEQQFSSDSQCLLAIVMIDQHTPTPTTELQIIDLNAMRVVYRQAIDDEATQLHYRWWYRS